MTWGQGSHGTNHVATDLNDCVLIEHFDGRPGTPLVGMSVSTFSQPQGQWKQTWVDNQGGYLDFSGGWHEDRMILQRQATREGVTFLQRMVWSDIEPDRLQWRWERSDDEGVTWQTQWHLRYARQSTEPDTTP